MVVTDLDPFTTPMSLPARVRATHDRRADVERRMVDATRSLDEEVIKAQKRLDEARDPFMKEMAALDETIRSQTELLDQAERVRSWREQIQHLDEREFDERIGNWNKAQDVFIGYRFNPFWRDPITDACGFWCTNWARFHGPPPPANLDKMVVFHTFEAYDLAGDKTKSVRERKMRLEKMFDAYLEGL